MFTLRNLSIGLLALVLMAGGLLAWHWRAERQLRLSFENLIERTEDRNWGGVHNLISDDYSDDWGLTRERGLELASQGLRHFYVLTIDPEATEWEIDGDVATVRSVLRVSGNGSGIAQAIVDRARAIDQPFEIEWRREGSMPGTWRVVSIRQPQLHLGSYSEYLP